MNGDLMRPGGFTRDSDNKAVAGICSAIAKRADMDVNVVRAITAVATLLSGGTVAVIYGVLWALLPERGQTTTYFEDAMARGRAMYDDYQATKTGRTPSGQPGPAPQTPRNPADPSDPYHLYED